MIEYPKIETLYNRDERTHKVIVGDYRHEAFRNIRYWHVTEKVDGTNVRVSLMPQGEIFYGGRTDAAQMPVFLLDYLRKTLTADVLETAFPRPRESEVILFGEGYGEKIQKGGGNYRKGVAMRLFDVIYGPWWLEPDDVDDVAAKCGILPCPSLGTLEVFPESAEMLASVFRNGGQSIVATEDGGAGLQAEGIVARTIPGLLTRRGHRLMWKLKFKDF